MITSPGRSLLRLGAGIVGVFALLVATAATTDEPRNTEPVGWLAPDRLSTPVNQIVSPAGRHVILPGLRPQGLALSPDGTLLVVSGKTSEVLVLDPANGDVRQRVPLPSEKITGPRPEVASPHLLEPDAKGILSFTGLVFSPDGRRLYLSNVNGNIKVFTVTRDRQVEPSHSIPLPPADALRRREEIPSGLAVSADGTRLYVCGNLSNRLLELDTAKGAVLRTWEVGVAPYDVVLAGAKAYVSNWGGGRPQPGDLTGPAGRGTVVKVDPVRHIANEGSVSVIPLGPGRAASIVTGLHASALAVAPGGRHVVCANAAADTLSVIDTRTDTVVETIWAKHSPADLFGASPNALCFTPDGRTLYAANGTQNAVAVIRFSPRDKSSALQGLIPTGWFPAALAFDPARRTLLVANLKGHPAAPSVNPTTGRAGYNSRLFTGSVSLVPVPTKAELKKLSALAYGFYRRERLAAALLPPRPDQPPRPVPERIGEPSTIRHVVYVIKENRTYDQVLGDVPQGNGDPALCIFGERVTPNQHKLVRDFVLLDNTYCSGILSADGHQWSTTAFGTDYLEKSFANWPRSYPDGMAPDGVDALAYAPSGFIWDNALKHSVSLWNFGEFALPKVRWTDPKHPGLPGWRDFWHEYQTGAGKVVIASEPGVASLRPFTPTTYIGWEMSVPDVWRARCIGNQVAEWERTGRMPQLVIICLPIDHTSGTKPGAPTPAACVADNDLAFGRIVEALSHTRFWKEMAVFGIEDDPQNGWDHVSGYRTTAYIASPWAKRGAVVNTQYNTTSLLRTIEQILGLPPMNQFDATATPMFDCFTATPDFTPFTAVPNNVPLDEMNPALQAIGDPLLRKNARTSARLDFLRADACPEDVLNRILWHAMKGSAAPFPAWAVSLTDEDD
ncbi:MAG: bifunctional YncE family protein/alkaline phosphatase family protein [Opitutae bacterium]|nr:bifunctional YncE family protein/alkaline phosphatase family protein [Opitutae bacterium]